MANDNFKKANAPWSFWLIAGVALLWNSFGAFDYVMSLTQGAAYYRQSGMNEALIAHYVSHPLLVFAPWTFGIGGAVVGSLLLLFRRREAVWAFIASLAGSIVSLVTTVLLASREALQGGMLIMPIVILGVSVGFVLYSRVMSQRGVFA